MQKCNNTVVEAVPHLSSYQTDLGDVWAPHLAVQTLVPVLLVVEGQNFVLQRIIFPSAEHQLHVMLL